MPQMDYADESIFNILPLQGRPPKAPQNKFKTMLKTFTSPRNIPAFFS
jgi:hypothetical protein